MIKGRFSNPFEATLTGIKDIFRKAELADRLTDQVRLDGRTCLVTGANTGLGFGIAQELANRGAHLIMACRGGVPEAGEKIRALTGSDKVEMIRVDLTDLDSIHALADELKERGIKLDAIINNAGVAPPKLRVTPAGLEEMFMVNYLAKFILLHRLLADGTLPNDTLAGNGRVEPPLPRVIIISSDSHQGAGPLDFAEFGKLREYGATGAIKYYSYYKLMLNTMATELSRRLTRSDGTPDVAVNVICPGPVDSDIARDAPAFLKGFMRVIFKLAFQSPEKAAKPVVYFAASEDWEGKTNQYLHMFNPKRMDPKVYADATGKELWERTEKLWAEIDPRYIPALSSKPAKSQ